MGGLGFVVVVPAALLVELRASVDSPFSTRPSEDDAVFVALGGVSTGQSATYKYN